MSESRRSHSAEFKFKMVLEVLKGEKTLNQIAGENKLAPAQLSQWKNAFMEHGSAVFGRSGEARHKTADFEKEKARMERKIGELTLCVDFLKKKFAELGL